MACIAVAGDHILASDLARALPAFAAADPTQSIAFSPLPGTQRRFTPREIEGLGRRFHLPDGLDSDTPVCFERETHAITSDQIAAAIQSSLRYRVARLEVVETSHAALPAGKLEFPFAGAIRPAQRIAGEPFVWRGKLITATGQSFPVWAKVRVEVQRPRIVATVALHRGETLAPAQIEFSQSATPLLWGDFAASPEQAVGFVLKQDIAAGQPIPSAALEPPREVLPGDMVHVNSMAGLAQLSFDAKAQTGGRRGDSILVQNPSNGRTFRAVVVDRGKVLAQAKAQ